MCFGFVCLWCVLCVLYFLDVPSSAAILTTSSTFYFFKYPWRCSLVCVAVSCVDFLILVSFFFFSTMLFPATRFERQPAWMTSAYVTGSRIAARSMMVRTASSREDAPRDAVRYRTYIHTSFHIYRMRKACCSGDFLQNPPSSRPPRRA